MVMWTGIFDEVCDKFHTEPRMEVGTSYNILFLRVGRCMQPVNLGTQRTINEWKH
jgi:hypothetical protein